MAMNSTEAPRGVLIDLVDSVDLTPAIAARVVQRVSQGPGVDV